jgi:hypothetical protein
MPTIVEPITSVEAQLGDIDQRLLKVEQSPIPVTVIPPKDTTSDISDDDTDYGITK